jgi:hypothetical protein
LVEVRVSLVNDGPVTIWLQVRANAANERPDETALKDSAVPRVRQ